MSHDLEHLHLPEGFAPDYRTQRLREVLANISGLKMHSGYEGTLAIGSSLAEATLETDVLHARLALGEVENPFARLQATHELPTNLRFALAQAEQAVLGDARLDADTLAESLHHMATGFRLALGKRPRGKATAEPLTAELVEAALDKTDFAPDQIVRHDGAWQLHPRLAGEAVPLAASIDGSDLLVSRKLVALTADHAACEVVAHQALRYNARLRHCRLAWATGHVVAEVRLPAALLTGASLMHHARGVAVAARHVQTTLEILARQPPAAAHYRSLFLGS